MIAAESTAFPCGARALRGRPGSENVQQLQPRDDAPTPLHRLLSASRTPPPSTVPVLTTGGSVVLSVCSLETEAYLEQTCSSQLKWKCAMSVFSKVFVLGGSNGPQARAKEKGPTILVG
jgi:hypothetical protein